MKHYFFTRIACDAKTIAPSAPPRPDKVHHQMCRLWLDKSAKMYRHWHRAKLDFQVVLKITECCRHIVDEYEWPEYVTITSEYPDEWAEKNVQEGDNVTFTRVDADDSYAVDFIKMLEEQPFTERTLMLHNWYRQESLQTGQITRPIYHDSSMFATIWWPNVTLGASGGQHDETKQHWMHGIIGNHGKYKDFPHHETEGCYALQRITGWNAANRWGLAGRNWREITVDQNPPERFTSIT